MKVQNSAIARGFGVRLREEMIAQGYKAQWSTLGADAEALKKAAGVSSLDIARRYLAGENMPRPERMAKIAAWLGVRVAWLRDGELPKTNKEMESAGEIDHAMLSNAISTVRKAASDHGILVDDDVIARAASLLYADLQAGRTIDAARTLDLLRVLA